MKDLVELLKWFLEKDIRAKNAASVLAGLILVVAFYFSSRHNDWFHEIQGYGAVGVGAALFGCLCRSIPRCMVGLLRCGGLFSACCLASQSS